MYFDDIYGSLAFQGETLAVKEFNAEHKNIKIAPEQPGHDWNAVKIINKLWLDPDITALRFKWCQRFDHPRFAIKRQLNPNL
jgi:hypothetical protein